MPKYIYTTEWIITLLFVFAVSLQTIKAQNTIHIYAEAPVLEDYMGVGVQWSAYPHAEAENAEWGKLMTDKEWQKVYRRLDYMKPRIIRVMDQAGWRYFQGVEEDGDPIIDFDNQQMQALYKLLDYCQNNDITVLFGEWGAPAFWDEPGNITRADDPRWIHMISSYLEHLIIDKGYTCIEYYNLVNEPNGNWASTDGDWEQWRSGVRMLRDSLESRGLDQFVRIAGPDAVTSYDNPKSKYTGFGWLRASVDQIDDLTGIYDIHAYPNGEIVHSGNLENFLNRSANIVKSTGKPIILGEIGLKYQGEMGEENRRRARKDPHAGINDSQMFVYEPLYALDVVDALIQSMNAGFHASIAWALDDAMHTVGDTGNPDRLKRWGMWNILGEELHDNPEDEQIRPWYYTWSLMSRHFPTGFDILQTDHNTPDSVRVVAGRDREHFSVAFINQNKTDKKLQLNVPNHPNGDTFRQYVIYGSEEKFDGQSAKTPDKTFKWQDMSKTHTLTLPANSFVLISNYNPETD